VWIAWKLQNNTAQATKFVFRGNRSEVRENTIFEALKGISSRF